ncbi:MAG: hypothetical protein M3297_01210, partial [Thermoproteota archaeon]|nr:hypothetical protein [Thermoproteota archaeon]
LQAVKLALIVSIKKFQIGFITIECGRENGANFAPRTTQHELSVIDPIDTNGVLRAATGTRITEHIRLKKFQNISFRIYL